ncbi:TetR/AcrR family transcriptional regulator [Desulforhopalus singaporensis]|uniref:Transcriptional regulator, TetR family n=1 Tax=Desulforhopalus singaporensis TaxID=91360 RepID=A0A1H0LBA2_9BACT|nr:TetR/AcrR family transcriptional regulator [Desulforhopalus singaporensis]SDO65477.1 transcriptional regulator, TetR family [Desulforhopalus singaporensis]
MRVDEKNSREIATQIKDKKLVEERRSQIVDCAVKLFIKHGYHKTTTRMLARETGLSIGSLYEYITTKDDVLYLVCMAIHNAVDSALHEAMERSSLLGGRESLKNIIREYFLVCNRMSDHVLLMYQVTHLLPVERQNIVLESELGITALFIDSMQQLKKNGKLILDDDTINLIGHNISVIGHTWAFRRWYFCRNFTIDQYIEKQTEFIMGFLPETIE